MKDKNAIISFLFLSFALFVGAFVSTASAANYTTSMSTPIVNPNPPGLGQPINIASSISPNPPSGSQYTIQVTGVDPNGNYIQIGTCTTQAGYGSFYLTWTPPVQGTWRITCSFAGATIAGNVYSSCQNSFSLTFPTPTPTSIITSISVSPASKSVNSGEAATYTVTVVGSGQVALSASGLPTGATATFNPATVTATSSGAISTLTVQTTASTPQGPSTLTIKGTAGAIEKTATTQLTFPTPTPTSIITSISVSPASNSVTQGQTATYTVNVVGSGTVSLSASGLPAGATSSFNPATVTATSSGATLTLTVQTATTTPQATSTLTIKGTQGTTEKTATTQLIVVPTSSVSVLPASNSVTAGLAAICTVTVVGSGQAVSLSASGLPAGATSSFSPATVTATSLGATSTLTIQTTASTPEGTSTLTIKGTSSGLPDKTATTQLVVSLPAQSLSASISPPTVTVTSGQAATFTASASGGASPPSFQWYEGTSIITGQTSPTLTTTKTTAGIYTFYCKITDSKSETATSNTATLTVTTAPPPPATIDHFTFAIINSPQQSGAAFRITITAKSADSSTVTSYTGTNTLSVSTGNISPSSTTAFSSGVWTGTVTLTETGSAISISTSGGGKVGTSNSFNLEKSVGSNDTLDHFEFAVITSPNNVNSAFELQITAKDQNGNTISTYNGTCKLTDLTGTISPTDVALVNGSSIVSVKISAVRSNNTITANDNGKSGVSNSFDINADSSFPIEYVIIGVVSAVAVIIVVVLLAVRKRKQSSKPPALGRYPQSSSTD